MYRSQLIVIDDDKYESVTYKEDSRCLTKVTEKSYHIQLKTCSFNSHRSQLHISLFQVPKDAISWFQLEHFSCVNSCNKLQAHRVLAETITRHIGLTNRIITNLQHCQVVLLLLPLLLLSRQNFLVIQHSLVLVTGNSPNQIQIIYSKPTSSAQSQSSESACIMKCKY